MLTYTCLPADDAHSQLGYTTIVAKESDRIPVAAFRNPAEASAYCDRLNKPPTTLTQSVGVVKT